MVKTWMTSTYNHGIVVIPIAVFMIWTARHTWLQLKPQFWPTALIGVAAAGLSLGIGFKTDIQLIQHISLVGLLISGAAMIFGPQLIQRWLFPLLFLFFMVPFGDILIPTLRSITAMATNGLLAVAGFSPMLDGLIISVTSGRFHIAEECSGLRFLLAAGMIASIFSYYAFSTWRQTFLFFMAAMVIAMTANFLRIWLVIVIAVQSNGTSHIIEGHLFIGWIFYAAAMTCLIFVGLYLSPSEKQA